MVIPDGVRKFAYWATIILAAVSAVATALATYFGIVDAEKIAQAGMAGTTVLGFLAGVFAIKNFTPNSTSSDSAD